MPEIKICGITNQREIEYLNENKVDYAGFVFFEKSKRNVTGEAAKHLLKGLNPEIKTVAVCVSPNADFVKTIEQMGFDILQIHGELKPEVQKTCRIPIWRAVNIQNIREAYQQLDGENAFHESKITGFVVDGANYGSGKTFCWEEIQEAGEGKALVKELKKKCFVLAGGLNAENVAKGIETFCPDVVDVSSGVEGMNGKEKSKIEEFVREVRRNG